MIAARAMVLARTVSDTDAVAARKRIPVAPESPARERPTVAGRGRRLVIGTAVIAAVLAPAAAIATL
jgi:hypothetical protein